MLHLLLLAGSIFWWFVMDHMLIYNFVLKVSAVKTYWIWAHTVRNTLYSVAQKDNSDWWCEKRVEKTEGAVDNTSKHCTEERNKFENCSC